MATFAKQGKESLLIQNKGNFEITVEKSGEVT
jgi:hypothetical protein